MSHSESIVSIILHVVRIILGLAILIRFCYQANQYRQQRGRMMQGRDPFVRLWGVATLAMASATIEVILYLIMDHLLPLDLQTDLDVEVKNIHQYQSVHSGYVGLDTIFTMSLLSFDITRLTESFRGSEYYLSKWTKCGLYFCVFLIFLCYISQMLSIYVFNSDYSLLISRLLIYILAIILTVIITVLFTRKMYKLTFSVRQSVDSMRVVNQYGLGDYEGRLYFANPVGANANPNGNPNGKGAALPMPIPLPSATNTAVTAPYASLTAGEVQLGGTLGTIANFSINAVDIQTMNNTLLNRESNNMNGTEMQSIQIVSRTFQSPMINIDSRNSYNNNNNNNNKQLHGQIFSRPLATANTNANANEHENAKMNVNNSNDDTDMISRTIQGNFATSYLKNMNGNSNDGNTKIDRESSIFQMPQFTPQLSPNVESKDSNNSDNTTSSGNHGAHLLSPVSQMNITPAGPAQFSQTELELEGTLGHFAINKIKKSNTGTGIDSARSSNINSIQRPSNTMTIDNVNNINYTPISKSTTLTPNNISSSVNSKHGYNSNNLSANRLSNNYNYNGKNNSNKGIDGLNLNTPPTIDVELSHTATSIGGVGGVGINRAAVSSPLSVMPEFTFGNHELDRLNLRLSAQQNVLLTAIAKQTLLAFCETVFYNVYIILIIIIIDAKLKSDGQNDNDNDNNNNVSRSSSRSSGHDSEYDTLGAEFYQITDWILLFATIVPLICIWFSFVFANKEYFAVCGKCHYCCLNIYSKMTLYRTKLDVKFRVIAKRREVYKKQRAERKIKKQKEKELKAKKSKYKKNKMFQSWRKIADKTKGDHDDEKDGKEHTDNDYRLMEDSMKL